MNKQGPNGISWCDYTWNPLTGCSPEQPWGEPVFHPERLGEPAKLKKPAIIFAVSVSDIGHAGVLPTWREAIWQAMLAAPWHTYCVLTKRPGEWIHNVPGLVWVGVTVENQDTVNRWDTLSARVSRRLFVSVEPILGPVSFAAFGMRPPWVIAGPLTGARGPDKADSDRWIEALSAESPCFHDKRKVGWTRREFPVGMKKGE